jgi:hypothetical protein
VFKDGKPTIRTSDSEDSDTDSSLESLSALLSQKTRGKNGVSNRPLSVSSSSIQLPSSNSNKPKRGLAALPPAPKYEFSIVSLVEQNKRDDAAARQLTAAKQKLQMLEAQNEAIERDAALSIDQNKFLSLVGQSDAEGNGEGDAKENAQRVVAAMKRIDAFRLETVYHFFQDKSESMPKHEFPTFALSEPWVHVLGKEDLRQTMFESGFVGRLVHQQPLPQEVLEWILEEACTHSLSDLTAAYIRILTISKNQLKEVMDENFLRRIIKLLGAKPHAMELSSQLETTSHLPNYPKNPLNNGILSLLTLLDAILRTEEEVEDRKYRTLSRETELYYLCVFFRILCDDSIASAISMRTITQRIMGLLIRSLSVDSLDEVIHECTKALIDSSDEAVLQRHLVSLLPTLTPAEHALKRSVALGFLLGRPVQRQAEFSSQSLMNEILIYLERSPLFRISPETDFRALASVVYLLDIALDVGIAIPLEISKTSLSEAVSAKKDVNHLNARAADKVFNANLDQLVQKIKLLDSRIIDRGASDMAKSEAKTMCSMLIHRVDKAVRRGERRRKDIFVKEDGEGVVKQRDFFAKWQKRASGMELL